MRVDSDNYQKSIMHAVTGPSWFGSMENELLPKYEMQVDAEIRAFTQCSRPLDTCTKNHTSGSLKCVQVPEFPSGDVLGS